MFFFSLFSLRDFHNGLDMSGYPEVLALRGLYDARNEGRIKGKAMNYLNSDLPGRGNTNVAESGGPFLGACCRP